MGGQEIFYGDRGSPRLTREEIDAFCAERGIAGYVVTSARQGDGLDALAERMRAVIRWDARPTTVTTWTFKRIKDYVLELKEAPIPEREILSPAELRARLAQVRPDIEFTDDELLTAVRHLPNHGYVALLRAAPSDTPIELTRQQADDLADQRREAGQRSRFEQALFRLMTYVTQEGIPAPDCFISYAWGDDRQERWVEHRHARDLANAGIKVILDRWENARIGASVPRFVERIAGAERVIVVGTPRYRTKYDNGEPMGAFVVAAEGDLIGQRLIGSEAAKETVLPVLLEGSPEKSFPPLLRGRVYADFVSERRYLPTVFDLITSLYQISEHQPVRELRRQLTER